MNLENNRKFYLLLLLETVLVVYVSLKKRLHRYSGKPMQYNSWFYDRLKACHEIRTTAERNNTALSLNVVYSAQGKPPGQGLDGILEWLWMNMPAAQAVRNRKAIVTSLLEREVRSLCPKETPITIAFFAGGFVETGIEVARRVIPEGISVHFIVLDISNEALAKAEAKAQEAGVAESFTFKRINLLNFAKVKSYLADKHIDAIEMIGILDYLTNEQAVTIFKLAKDCLPYHGLLITGNILPLIWEAPFLYTVINWPSMIHRTEHQLGDLLNKAGFICNTHPIIEPHQVFMVQRVWNYTEQIDNSQDAPQGKKLQATLE